MKRSIDFENESAKCAYVPPIVKIQTIEVDVVTESGGGATFEDYDADKWF